MIYPYAEGDLLEQRHDYFYSAFHGAPFLDAWRASRQKATRTAPASTADAGSLDVELSNSTGMMLDRLFEVFAHGSPESEHWRSLDRLVHRFEVSKRIHAAYGTDCKPLDMADYRDLRLYVAFAEVLARAASTSRRLSYLSALLKCMDILCAYVPCLGAPWQPRFLALIASEERLVRALERAVQAEGT